LVSENDANLPAAPGAVTNLWRTGTYRGDFTVKFPVHIGSGADACQNIETRSGYVLLSVLVKSNGSVPSATLFVIYERRSFGNVTCVSGALYPPGVWFWDLNYGGWMGDFSSESLILAQSHAISTSLVLQDVTFTGLVTDQWDGAYYRPVVKGQVQESLTSKGASGGTSSFTVPVTLTRQPD